MRFSAEKVNQIIKGKQERICEEDFNVGILPAWSIIRQEYRLPIWLLLVTADPSTMAGVFTGMDTSGIPFLTAIPAGSCARPVSGRCSINKSVGSLTLRSLQSGGQKPIHSGSNFSG
jgi:hypothetical protein